MNKAVLVFALTAISATALADEINYYQIAEAHSARIEKNLVRYARLYGESCANIQIINPGSWQAIKTERICSFNGLSFETDFADAHFSEPEFSSNGLHLKLSITPLEPTGEKNKECFIPIKDKSIGPMECIDSN